MTEPLWAFVFGAVLGSFVNVVILRIPKDESVVVGFSRCPTCNNTLKPQHNIPLFSWIFLRGRCAFCGSAISAQYPLIELISGLVFLVLYAKTGIGAELLFAGFSFLTLLALSAIDLKYKAVPDSLNLLAIIFALFAASGISEILDNFQNALLFAGGFTLLRFALSYILTSSLRRHAKKTVTSWSKNYHTYPFVEAMGEGDIMVAAAIGALLGVKLTLFAVFLSALLALPVMLLVMNRSKEEQRIPFVPFLSTAAFITYVFDIPILRYFEAAY